MSVTIQQLFNAIDPEKMNFMVANNALMALDMGNKKKPPSAQIALPAELVRNLMIGGERDALIVISVKRDEWIKAVDELAKVTDSETE